MPLPMMVPTTIAPAWLTPKSSGVVRSAGVVGSIERRKPVFAIYPIEDEAPKTNARFKNPDFTEQWRHGRPRLSGRTRNLRVIKQAVAFYLGIDGGGSKTT